MTIIELTAFLGCMTVINIGILLFAAIVIILFRNSITKLHSKLFSVHQEDLSKIYFKFLGQYKCLIIVFNLVPYIALHCFK